MELKTTNLANRSRTWLCILFCVASAHGIGAQTDPIFAAIPFDRWLETGEPAQIRWTTKIFPAVLSAHQRFRTRVGIDVDGNEFAKQRGKGQLMMLTQFMDSAGRAYQTHRTIGLDDLKESAPTVDFVFTLDAFVIPGDYRVSLGVVATATGEHSTIRKTLHVGALRNDQLPGAWRDLPAVEFVTPPVDTPDSWYLPDVTTRLSLPLESQHPVGIQLLVNVSPSEWPASPRIGRINNANLSVLIPALKVISQIDLRNGSLSVALLDVTRRRVILEQKDIRELTWPGLKTVLLEENPNLIDAHSLEQRDQNAQFFVSEVGRRMIGARALIILTGPMAFARGEDLRPIDVPGNPNCRIFYIRYSQPVSRRSGSPVFGPSPIGRGGPPLPPVPRPQAGRTDTLERTLKPLEPRLFDVDTAEQFRKALSIVLAEIARI